MIICMMANLFEALNNCLLILPTPMSLMAPCTTYYPSGNLFICKHKIKTKKKIINGTFI